MSPNGTYFRPQFGRDESQRDSDPKPKVARNELPWEAWAKTDNPNRVAARWWKSQTQGSSCLATLGWKSQSLWDCRTAVDSSLPPVASFAWNFRKALFPALPLVALAFLAGCAVGPDYKRPEATTIPPAYAGATNGWKVAVPQAQVPKGNWWEIFGDTELSDLESQATAANQQLKAAVARFAEARAQIDVARSGLFPNVTVSGSATRQRTSPNAPAGTGKRLGTASTFNDFSVPLDLSYEVDLWGRVRRSVESARAQGQASADDVEAIKLAIQAEVAMDYFALRALDSQRAVLNSSVEVFTKSLQLTRNRRAGGVVSDLDVAQAQTVLKTTQAQLPAVALKRAQFEHALALLVGQPASTFRIPERALSAAPPLIPPGLPSELLERRPDIAAAERRMAAANASIGVAKAAFFPTIQLNGLAGLESLDAGTLFNGSSRLWAVGPSLTLPLFGGGRLLAARKQLEIANNRYRDGLITYLEVATAESTALNVEFAAVQLHGQQLVAAVTLIKSLGGGWPETMTTL